MKLKLISCSEYMRENPASDGPQGAANAKDSKYSSHGNEHKNHNHKSHWHKKHGNGRHHEEPVYDPTDPMGFY